MPYLIMIRIDVNGIGYTPLSFLFIFNWWFCYNEKLSKFEWNVNIVPKDSLLHSPFDVIWEGGGLLPPSFAAVDGIGSAAVVKKRIVVRICVVLTKCGEEKAAHYFVPGILFPVLCSKLIYSPAILFFWYFVRGSLFPAICSPTNLYLRNLLLTIICIASEQVGRHP